MQFDMTDSFGLGAEQAIGFTAVDDTQVGGAGVGGWRRFGRPGLLDTQGIAIGRERRGAERQQHAE